jgi:hypothetical protein
MLKDEKEDVKAIVEKALEKFSRRLYKRLEELEKMYLETEARLSTAPATSADSGAQGT